MITVDQFITRIQAIENKRRASKLLIRYSIKRITSGAYSDTINLDGFGHDKNLVNLIKEHRKLYSKEEWMHLLNRGR